MGKCSGANPGEALSVHAPQKEGAAGRESSGYSTRAYLVSFSGDRSEIRSGELQSVVNQVPEERRGCVYEGLEGRRASRDPRKADWR